MHCASVTGRSVRGQKLADFPEVLEQWDAKLNPIDIDPATVAAGSSKRYHWRCSQGPDHSWEAPVGRRTLGIGCPFCSSIRVSVTNSLATKFPSIAEQWHPTKNGDLSPSDVLPMYNVRKVWWKCPEEDDHEWEDKCASRVSNFKRTGGGGCPMCAGRRVVKSNCLTTKLPDIAAQWHPTKNGDLKPEDVTESSSKKVWWKCPMGEDHEWQTSPNSRWGKTGCPFCVGQRVSVTNSLASLFPDIAAEWHPTKNGDLSPDDVTAHSGKVVWWKCPVGTDHEFPCAISSRTKKEPTVCPVCYGRVAVLSNCLATTHPELAEEWHPTKNGDLTPQGVTKGSNKKVWWKCKKHDHEWRTNPNSRDLPGCPICLKKNQMRLFEIVKTIFSEKEVLFDYKASFMKFKGSGIPMELDIWIPEERIALEYQGQQHFTPFFNNNSLLDELENIRRRDEEKRQACKDNDIVLVEIKYTWDRSMEYVLDSLEQAGIEI